VSLKPGFRVDFLFSAWLLRLYDSGLTLMKLPFGKSPSAELFGMPVATSPHAESFRSDISPATPGSVHSGHMHHQLLNNSHAHGPSEEMMSHPHFFTSSPGPRFMPMR
jgi:hypothetical protein